VVAIPILDRFTPEEWTAISAAATFVVALLVVEMKEDRLAQTRPHIILDFAVSGEDLHLRIRNYGGPASQVRFLFVPPLTNSSGRDIGRMPLLSVPLPLLPEGEVLEETFD
jgi:hypothetical protein